MSNKNLNSAIAGISLHIGTPTQSGMDLGIKQHAAPGMFMNLPVGEIDFFDKNPRRFYDKESYHNIKESIRATGVQQPVHVTQRPGATRYVLSQGGNTRLKIMQELFAETGDKQFSTIPCLYQLYTNDTSLQIAHLIENEQRAEMCFWDKARAYSEIRDILIEDEHKKPSLRELEVLFGIHGLNVSYTLLGLFFFADERLSALGDMCSGLSKAKVFELRKLYNEFSATLEHNDISELFDDFWRNKLQDWSNKYSGDASENWELTVLIEFLRTAFQQEFSGAASLPQKKSATEKTSITQQETATDFQTDDAVNTVYTLSDQEKTDVQTASASAASGSSSIQLSPAPANTPPEGGAYAPVDPEHKPVHENESCANPEQVRKQLHVCIKKWLAQVNLNDCFRAHSGFELGFYVEYPAFEKIPNSSDKNFIVDALHPQAGNVFTYLAKLSGQEKWLFPTEEKARLNPILTLPESSKLRIAYMDPDKYDEFTQFGIGDRADLLSEVLVWQTMKTHCFNKIVADVLHCTTQLRNDGGMR